MLPISRRVHYSLIYLLTAVLLQSYNAQAGATFLAHPPQRGSAIRGQLKTLDGTVYFPCVVVLTNQRTRNQKKLTARRAAFAFENLSPDIYTVNACVGSAYQFPARFVKIKKEGDVETIVIHESSVSSNEPVRKSKRARGKCLSVLAVKTPIKVEPGETAYVRVIVQNNCKKPGVFELRVDAPAGASAITYDDTNGDGIHQDKESAISQTDWLMAGGGQQRLIVRINVPTTAWITQIMNYTLSVRSKTIAGGDNRAVIVMSRQNK